MSMNETFYLCSGFHRSGTSLVARSMSENAVHMGLRLMGASFANPQGHVEDMDMVSIHDRILTDNGVDWRYCNPAPMRVTDLHKDAMQGYLEQRFCNADGDELIGAKDPRALLFLDDWQALLGDRLKAILVYRDWKLSVSSLLKRHSRELLNYSVNMSERTLDYGFWKYPDQAAVMWLHAAHCMIRRIEKHPETTLLFEQRAFIENNSAVKNAANARGIDGSVLALKGYQANLLQDSFPSSTLDMISPDVIAACNRALDKLNKLAAVVIELPPPSRPSTRLAQQLREGNISDWPVNASLPPNQHCPPAAMSWHDIQHFLKTTPAADIQINWRSVLNDAELTTKQYEDIFAVAMKAEQWAVAEVAMFRALHIKPAPWRWMHLGDIYLRLRLFTKAKECFERAQEMDEDNPTFMARLACVAFYTDDLVTGERLLDSAKTIDPEKPAVKNAQALLAQIKGKKTSAGKRAEREGAMQQVHTHETVVAAMTDNLEQGRILDDRLVKTAFLKRDNAQWLKTGLSALSPSAGKNLADHLTTHLRHHWQPATILTEMTDHSAPLATTSPSLKGVERNVKLGVHLHVYYLQLLPEIFDFLAILPASTEIVVTCMRKDHSTLLTWFAPLHNVRIKSVLNRGRDIGPWLLQAAALLSHCDLVLKLHTKATPHAAHLKHWRLQLLWSLIGNDDRLSSVLDTFSRNANLGIVMPDYHPAIIPDLTWGSNKPLATELAEQQKLPLPQDLGNFPAGSMFWYRPAALKPLFENQWQIIDFPEESGQTDGTIMHVIERLLPAFAEKAGFTAIFSQQCVIDE